MITVVMVIYNTEISNITSLDMCRKSKYVDEIIVCDNSEHKFMRKKNAAACKGVAKLRFLDMAKNEGLPKAYNTAVALSTSAYTCILDDDTTLPEHYFESAVKHIESTMADIYLPIVRSDKIVMSPCVVSGYRIKCIDNIRNISDVSKLSAINSGMIVKTSLFDKCKYDEKLFVDMVDHAFMRDAHKYGASICVMQDVVIKQQYSREIDDKETQLSRMAISIKDNRVFYSNSIGGRVFCYIQILYWKIKLAIKYRDITILTRL